MASKLKTGWKRIGRSGNTVDGRKIDDKFISEMAESYDPKLYTALIWYEHFRGFNLGKVEKVRFENNAEGGVDLYAIIAPNDTYQQINTNGQKLFTSMEITPNFRDTGKAYLTGLGATDNPASAATEELRFSRVQEPNVLLSQHVENTTHEFSEETNNEEDQAPNWLKRLLFKNDTEDAMSKEALAALQTKFDSLEQKFSAAFPNAPDDKGGDAGGGESGGDADDKYAALETKITALAESFKALTDGMADDKGESEQAKQFAELKKDHDELVELFKAATGEQDGTDAGEDTGSEDLNAYI